jgi:outer membrane lipoprotein LolB
MIVFKAFCFAVLMALVLAMTGCASLMPAREAPPRAQPFDVLGRVLVSYQGSAMTANYRWMHAADADDLWLMTPTGQALAQIREDAEGATITTAEHKQYRASRVEALTQRALGWELPISHLQHWIRATPVPNLPSEIVERDAAGKIRQLAQDGWRITYDYYPATQYEGLPRRMEVVGAAQTLRLVIDTWRAETSETP